MASQQDREDDAQRWADNTSWEAVEDGVENRTRDPSEGLAEYLGVDEGDIPDDFDGDWEDGLNRDDAEQKYNDKTEDSDTWLEAFEDPSTWTGNQ